MDRSTLTILTILHLDDDALYLEQFAALMQQASLDASFKVLSTDQVEGYLSTLARLKPEIVVLDINVAGNILGMDLAARTRAIHPACLIFMCSDMRGVGLIRSCLDGGADDFIFKGGDERELALRIYGTWKLRSEAKANIPKSPPMLSRAEQIGATMQAVAARTDRIIRSAITAIHVRGESGTGKELVSDLIAERLPKGTPFVRINCGAIAPTLLESELFGHVRGAFTGAASDKMGLFEQANGGWVFLDEVATLSSAAQVALLRVLENQSVRRVGAPQERKVHVRILSATNEPVEELIAAGRFRSDLWQRLCEAEINLPPLRQRMQEFPELVKYFCQSMHSGPFQITDSAFEILANYDWRDGNIRELRNCLRAMTELAINKTLTPLSLPQWFWNKIDTKKFDRDPSQGDQPLDTATSAKSLAPTDIRLPWSDTAPLPFESLTSRLLLEIIKRQASLHGKVSVRQLARVTSIPKSTLSAKLRALIDQDLIEPAELAKLVNIAWD